MSAPDRRRAVFQRGALGRDVRTGHRRVARGHSRRALLESAAMAKQGSYAEASIRVLKGLEPVKQRPGMYTRTDNPLHIIQEGIDNAADEALAGHGKRIEVI